MTQTLSMTDKLKLTINAALKTVRIDTPGMVELAELYRKIREWEASEEGIVFPDILEGSGNIELPDKTRTPLVVVFVNGWHLDAKFDVQLIGGALSARDISKKTEHPVAASARNLIRFSNDTAPEFVPSEAQTRYALYEAAKFREDWEINPAQKLVSRRVSASGRILSVLGLYWFLKEEWLRSPDLIKFPFPIEGDNLLPIDGLSHRWTILNGWKIPEYDLKYIAGGPLVCGNTLLVPAYAQDDRPVSLDAAKSVSERNKIKIGIVTALPKEYVAVCAQLDNVKDFCGTERSLQCRLGTVPARNGGLHHVAVVMTPVGNTSAASKTTALLYEFPELKEVVMVGIAGAVPNPSKVADHVRLGDIVVSGPHGVVQYDYVKETETFIEPRHPPRAPSPRFLETVRLLEADFLKGAAPWNELLKKCSDIRNTLRPDSAMDLLATSENTEKFHTHPEDPSRPISNEPRIFVGTIGAANVLLKNPKRRDQLRDKYNVKAIEMESSGIADASYDFQIGFFVFGALVITATAIRMTNGRDMQRQFRRHIWGLCFEQPAK